MTSSLLEEINTSGVSRSVEIAIRATLDDRFKNYGHHDFDDNEWPYDRLVAVVLFEVARRAEVCSDIGPSNLIEETIQFLKKLRACLNPYLRSSHGFKLAYFGDDEPSELMQFWLGKAGLLWMHRDAYYATERRRKEFPEAFDNYWPVSGEELVDEYMANPWLEAPQIDFILVDSMVYFETLMFGERNNIGSKGNFHCWLKKVTSKVRKPSPQQQLFDEMHRINFDLRDTTISPAWIRERLLATAGKGACWPAQLIAVVERAAKRNPVAWAFG